jgi:hypothetical protein
MARTVRELQAVIAGLTARLGAVRERVARGEHDNGKIREIVGDLNAATTELRHAQFQPGPVAAAPGPKLAVAVFEPAVFEPVLEAAIPLLAAEPEPVLEAPSPLPAPVPEPVLEAPSPLPAVVPEPVLDAPVPSPVPFPVPSPVAEVPVPEAVSEVPKPKKKLRAEPSLDDKLQALSDRLKKHRMAFSAPFAEPGVVDLARTRTNGAGAGAGAGTAADPARVPAPARVPLRKSFHV